VNLICKVIDFTCDYCDLKEVEKLSDLFLEKFLSASIKRFPRNYTLSKMNNLKNFFLLALQLPDKEIQEKLLSSAGLEASVAPSVTTSASSTSTTGSVTSAPLQSLRNTTSRISGIFSLSKNVSDKSATTTTASSSAASAVSVNEETPMDTATHSDAKKSEAESPPSSVIK
jgi:hypothetical protein